MFEKFGITPRVEVMFDSYEVAAERLLGTNSWSLFPDWIAELYTGLSCLAPPKGWEAPVRVEMIRSKNRLGTKVIKRLCRRLREDFKKAAAGNTRSAMARA
ncbi:MAG: hypothetical protein HY921_00380 [Elusimicrobia bacterium]|nr:hypothetical protein [Elusimicrobiota bacterium]